MSPTRKILNVVAACVMVALLLLTLAWCGVFSAPGSDEEQIHSLIDSIQTEVSDHDWDDVLMLCDVTPQRAEAWKAAIPRQANLLVIDHIRVNGFISVPAGATEYEISVTVTAHLAIPMSRGLKLQAREGVLYFVKRDGQWLLDLERTGPALNLPSP